MTTKTVVFAATVFRPPQILRPDVILDLRPFLRLFNRIRRRRHTGDRFARFRERQWVWCKFVLKLS